MAPYLLYPGYSGALTDWKAEILNNLTGKATNEFIQIIYFEVSQQVYSLPRSTRSDVIAL